MGRTDRLMDRRTPDRYIMLSTRCIPRNDRLQTNSKQKLILDQKTDVKGEIPVCQKSSAAAMDEKRKSLGMIS